MIVVKSRLIFSDLLVTLIHCNHNDDVSSHVLVVYQTSLLFIAECQLRANLFCLHHHMVNVDRQALMFCCTPFPHSYSYALTLLMMVVSSQRTNDTADEAYHECSFNTILLTRVYHETHTHIPYTGYSVVGQNMSIVLSTMIHFSTHTPTWGFHLMVELFESSSGYKESSSCDFWLNAFALLWSSGS
jgi:hypothetical protein